MTDIKFLSSLGSRIREIRKEKSITQTTLAELCEIEKANMSRIESGKTNVTVLTLLKISKALNTPVSDILANMDVRADGIAA
ncbi:MAG: transcriptional regulator [Bacteroidota bacterium]|nr:transcriptional regulator [Bacteroidota bacterium]